MGGGDERSGELGDLVDDDVGLICVDDRIEVVGGGTSSRLAKISVRKKCRWTSPTS